MENKFINRSESEVIVSEKGTVTHPKPRKRTARLIRKKREVLFDPLCYLKSHGHQSPEKNLLDFFLSSYIFRLSDGILIEINQPLRASINHSGRANRFINICSRRPGKNNSPMPEKKNCVESFFRTKNSVFDSLQMDIRSTALH